MRVNWDGLGTAALVLAAAVISVATVRRELQGSPVYLAQSAGPSGPPTFVDDWTKLFQYGRWIGDSNAPVRIVEFADFECPYCRQFHDVLLTVQHRFGAKVAVLFVHYPLRSHRFAMIASRVAECAATQGKFPDAYDALYREQDSFGLRSWSEFGRDVKVTDQDRFSACIGDTAAMPLVVAGRDAGDRLKITGTPSIIINGWRYPVPPYDSLLAIVQEYLSPGGQEVP